MWVYLHILYILRVLAHTGGDQLAKELHLMPFVIVQEINPRHLKAPQDIYKPGSVHDIP